MSEFLKMLALILLSLAYADDLSYSDQQLGIEYDWSSLQRSSDNPWKISTGDDLFLSSTYYFNFGKDLDRSCSTDSVSAIEVVELFGYLFETCQVVGRHQMWAASLIDKRNPNKGIEISYSGGDRCSLDQTAFSGSPRSITFRLICSSSESDWAFTEDDELGACEAIIEKYTKAGCPYPVSAGWNKFWKYLIWGLGAVVVYMFAGCLYNIAKGKTGMDALPSLNFWSELPEKVKGGLDSTSIKLKTIVSKGTNGATGGRSYELI